MNPEEPLSWFLISLLCSILENLLNRISYYLSVTYYYGAEESDSELAEFLFLQNRSSLVYDSSDILLVISIAVFFGSCQYPFFFLSSIDACLFPLIFISWCPIYILTFELILCCFKNSNSAASLSSWFDCSYKVSFSLSLGIISTPQLFSIFPLFDSKISLKKLSLINGVLVSTWAESRRSASSPRTFISLYESSLALFSDLLIRVFCCCVMFSGLYECPFLF